MSNMSCCYDPVISDYDTNIDSFNIFVGTAVETEDIEQQLEISVTDIAVKSACEKDSIKSIIEDQSITGRPRVTFFKHSEEVQKILPAISKSHKSKIYMKQLQLSVAQMRRNKGKPRKLTVEEFAEQIFRPVHSHLTNVSHSLLDGTISLHVITELFPKRESLSDIEFDMQNMLVVSGSGAHISDKRCSQIMYYTKIQQMKEIGLLTLFREMQEKLQLRGEFQVISDLCSVMVSVL